MNPKLLGMFLVGALMASVMLNVVFYKRLHPPAPKQRPPSPFEELQLTSAQIGVLNRCGMDCREAAEELQQQTARITEELRQALSEDNLDEEHVRELAAELGRLRNQEIDNNIATLIEVRNVLEPKQVRTLYRALYPDKLVK